MNIKSSQPITLTAWKLLLQSICVGVCCAIVWISIPSDQGMDTYIKLSGLITFIIVYCLQILIFFVYLIIIKYREIKSR